MCNLINTHKHTHTHNDLRQPITVPGIVTIVAAVANSSRCAVPQQPLRSAGAFSCNCMFQGEKGGGLTRQPVGPCVNTAIMTILLSTNPVDSRRFSSRGCAFRRTHTGTDPIRQVRIRLALPSTLSLPSTFAPSSKLMAGVWLAFFFFVTVPFGTIGEEALLGNQWAHR